MHMGDAPGIGTAADVRVGVTTISGGTTGRLLYDNGGVLGEISTTLSGSDLTFPGSVTVASGSAFVVLGRSKITSSADGIATISNNAGNGFTQFNFGDNTSSSPGLRKSSANLDIVNGDNSLFVSIRLAGFTLGTDTPVTRRTTATLNFGAADAAAPVAQTTSVQCVVAGTADTAGANWTLQASRGTGTGVGGAWTVQVAPAGSTGSTQNTLVDGLSVKGTKSVVVGSAAIATDATDGFLYVPGCAGPPTGTPTSFTGRVPIVVDTTNHKFYFFSGGSWRDAGP